ncbi:MAG: uroporphyrinogen-III synthase [Gemmatimonadaceae bacterium]
MRQSVAHDGLKGARVALLEARFGGELAELVRRHGGEPLSAPAVREAALNDDTDIAAVIDRLAGGLVDVVVVLTGVGCRLLFAAADRLGRDAQLRSALGAVTVVARGPKPAAALRARGVRPSIDTCSPFTTTELLEALRPVDLTGRRVSVIAYGERSEELDSALRARGAITDTVQLYEWRLPDDTAPLRSLVGELVAGRVDAIAFTSQVQARHLFAIASEMHERDALVHALRCTTAVASIGPTCTAALDALGVPPHVTANPPKMRPMITALTEYLAIRSGGRAMLRVPATTSL